MKSFVKLGAIRKVMAQNLKQGDNVVEWDEIHSESNWAKSPSHYSKIFYVVILYLPPSCYADLLHIHLIAMCNSNDLKSENGLDFLLNAIVEDLSDL
jgi:hypothetical protein